MRLASVLAFSVLLLACKDQDDQRDASSPATSDRSSVSKPTAPGARKTDEHWHLQSSGEGVALALLGPSDGTTIRLFCPSGAKTLLVNVSGFRPIGSEERMSFGSEGQAVTLVADSRGDAQRGGVSGTGAVPANLAAVLARALSASYGEQTSGPHPIPPAELSRAFAATCEPAAIKHASTSRTPPSACLMQGRERLRGPRLRAVGTEPFWGARIEGRCVTYSHPENQDGTRVWTRYRGTADGATWSGALEGRPFSLRMRAQTDCSDGMSDKRYPYAIELLVGGEKRQGCAERF